MIDISGLDKADVLAALYNASQPQGLGILHYDPTPMTPADAMVHLGIGGTGDDHADSFNTLREKGVIIARAQTYFDYLNGRVMKVDISKNQLEERFYDRDNGQGAAARALAPLLAKRVATEAQ